MEIAPASDGSRPATHSAVVAPMLWPSAYTVVAPRSRAKRTTASIASNRSRDRVNRPPLAPSLWPGKSSEYTLKPWLARNAHSPSRFCLELE